MSFDKVTKLSDHKPHLSIHVGNDIHIFPISTFKDVISGALCFTDIDDWDDILPVIINEWLKSLGGLK